MKYNNKKVWLSSEELNRQIKEEINESLLPKQEAGKTSIILCRNNKIGIKWAKNKFKKELNDKNYPIERKGILHQIVNSNPKMNLKIKIN